MANVDKKSVRMASEKPKAPKPAESVGRKARSKVKGALAKGAGAPPPAGPDRPPTREQLIDRLALEAQYDERADTLLDLIQKDIFTLGVPMPSRERVMDTFSLEQLELASTLQKPTLLLVPETSFRAKVAALNATKTMEGQQDAFVDWTFNEPAYVSEMITGWKAVIVEGAKKMKTKKGDRLGAILKWRIDKRKATRKPGERGMDRHLYAMLMLNGLLKGEPIDRDSYTLLDDEHDLSFPPGVLVAYWYDGIRKVFFIKNDPDFVNKEARLRSAVGGVVKSG